MSGLRPVWRNELGGLTYQIGTDRYVKSNLITAPVPGEMAVTDRWTAEPRTAVTAIAEAPTTTGCCGR